MVHLALATKLAVEVKQNDINRMHWRKINLNAIN